MQEIWNQNNLATENGNAIINDSVVDNFDLFDKSSEIVDVELVIGQGKNNKPSKSSDKIIIEVFDLTNDELISANGALYINTVPEMPKFLVSAVVPKSWGFAPLFINIKIEYSRQITDNNGTKRNRKTSLTTIGKPIFRSGDANFKKDTKFKPYDKGGRRNFEFEFNKIRGGDVTITAYNDDKMSNVVGQFKFKIKGENPSNQQINNYLRLKGYDQQFWFFKGLIMQESTNRQFNGSGMPLWGGPDGWGLTQRDQQYQELTDGDLDYLWDWKKNIDVGINTINEKINYAIDLLNKQLNTEAKTAFNADPLNFEKASDVTYGNITLGHVKTTLPRLDQFNVYFDDNTGSKKSFLDATVIRLFNGGQFYTLQKVKNNKYKWVINDTNNKDRNYVKDVCEKI